MSVQKTNTVSELYETGDVNAGINNIGKPDIQNSIINSIPLDAKEVGDLISGRREPDILPAGSFQKLPEAFEFITKKFDSNPQLIRKIIILLKSIVIKLGEESREFEIFTQAVKIPKKIDIELLNLMGVSADTIRRAGNEIGFSLLHRMQSDPYYITLSYLYFYGARINNSVLRQFALTLILVKLYRGRIARMWKRGFDETTVRYVMEKKLRSTSMAKKFPNTFEAIIMEWVPRIDAKYWELVRDHPAHELRGMSSILTASHTRINQMYVGLAKHYYDAFADGFKTGSNMGNEDMQEKGNMTRIGDFTERIYTAMVYINNPISEEDKNEIRKATNTSHNFIATFESFIKEPNNEQEIRELIELFLTVLKVESNHDIANMNLSHIGSEISKAKAKEQILKIKLITEGILKYLFSNYNTWAESSKLAVRRAFILLFLLKIQQPFIKKQKYFNSVNF